MDMVGIYYDQQRYCMPVMAKFFEFFLHRQYHEIWVKDRLVSGMKVLLTFLFVEKNAELVIFLNSYREKLIVFFKEVCDLNGGGFG